MNLSQLPALSQVKTVALDLDGVVYVGDRLLPGAAEAIRRIRELGLKVWYVTNNSGKMRVDIARKLTLIGVPATESEVLTSGYAAGFLLSRLIGQDQSTVLVIGSDSLKAEIVQFGLRIVDRAPCHFLVVGLDRDFHYEKICTALDALLGGASFVACNRDARFPGGDGRLLPGCGSIVAAIEHACGRKPDYEVGKPNTLLLEMITAEDDVKPHEVLVVGDVLESDIAMAHHFGSPSVLVSATEANAESDVQPVITLSALEELPTLLLAACQYRQGS